MRRPAEEEEEAASWDAWNTRSGPVTVTLLDPPVLGADALRSFQWLLDTVRGPHLIDWTTRLEGRFTVELTFDTTRGRWEWLHHPAHLLHAIRWAHRHREQLATVEALGGTKAVIEMVTSARALGGRHGYVI